MRKRKLYLSELIKRYYRFETTIISISDQFGNIDSLEYTLFLDKYKDNVIMDKEVKQYTIIKSGLYITVKIRIIQ